MDLRKVIKFGKATYSMTLPKEWVVEQGLKKGDLVRVEKSKGKLEVYPNTEKAEVEVKKTTIQADNKDIEEIFREVVAAYIKNYTIITIRGDVKGKVKDLRYRLQEFMGLEIMEIGPDKIVAKSFIDITETKINQTLRRVFYIIKSMSEEFRQCVKKKSEVEEIMEMDREINRNAFFIMKFLFKTIENPSASEDMDNFEAFFTWELIKLLERIADKIKMMADIAANREILVKENATKDFLSIYDDVEKNFNRTMEEYFKKNKEDIHTIFKVIDENEEKCNEFLHYRKMAWTPLLLDHLKDINMFTRNIAEIIVDFE